MTGLTPGRDGIVRMGNVRLANGTTLNRPIQRLYLIEVQAAGPAEPLTTGPVDGVGDLTTKPQELKTIRRSTDPRGRMSDVFLQWNKSAGLGRQSV